MDETIITRENLLKHLVIIGQRIASKSKDNEATEDFRYMYLAIRGGGDAGVELFKFFNRHKKVEPNMVSILTFAATTGLAPGSGWAVVDGDLIYMGIQ